MFKAYIIRAMVVTYDHHAIVNDFKYCVIPHMNHKNKLNATSCH
jgi:hypothetical protein